MKIDDPADRADDATKPSPWSRDGSSVWNEWADEESPGRSDRQPPPLPPPPPPPPQTQAAQVRPTQLPPPDVASAIMLRRPDAPASEASQSSSARRNRWLGLVAVFALGVAVGGVVNLVANRSDPPSSSVDAQDTDSAGSARDLSGETIEDPSSATTSNEEMSASPTDGAVDLRPLPEDAQRAGDLFPEAAYDEDYGVLDPTLFPEIRGVAPTTASNLDRWLEEFTYSQSHVAVRIDPTTAGVRPWVTWEELESPPPTWLLEREGSTDRFEADAYSATLIFRRTLDGTWVAVWADKAVEGELVGWIDGLSSVASVADVAAPPGFAEVPIPSTSIELKYTLTSQGSNITLRTFQFESGLDDAQVQNLRLGYGPVGPPVTDFQGVGTLYPIITSNESSGEVQVGINQYWWEVNRHLFVLVEAWSPTLNSSDRDQLAQALSLASELDGKDGRPMAWTPKIVIDALRESAFDGSQTVDDDTEVFNVRYGALGTERFAYLERFVRGANSTGQRCATLVVGGTFFNGGCTTLDETGSSEDGALCAYRLEPWESESLGTELYLIVDPSVADQVEVSIEGVPVAETEMNIVSGTTGDKPWTLKSAWLPQEPDVSVGDLNCQQLSSVGG